MNREQLIALFAATFLAVFLEVWLDLPRAWLSTAVSFLPSVLVYAAVRYPVHGITLVAVVGGLWHDSFSANPLGTSTAALFAAGYVLQRNREVIMHQLLFSRVVLGFAAGVVVPMLTLGLMSVTQREVPWHWALPGQILLQGLAAAVFTPLIFRLFARFHRDFTFATEAGRRPPLTASHRRPRY